MLPNPSRQPAATEPAPIPLTVTIDDTGSFTFLPPGNVLTFDPALDTLIIDLTLESTGNVAWAIAGIVFTPKKFDGETPTALPAGTSCTLAIPRPAHYFTPWSFQVVATAETVHGVLSPSFYVSLPTDSPGVQSLDLTYVSASGAFVFTAAGFPLESSQLLVNTVLPLTVNVTIQGPSFDTTPISWSAGAAPPWAQLMNPGPDPNALALGLTGAASGQIAGFRLVVDVGDVRTASPDPILVNAPLGDGGVCALPSRDR